MMAVTRGARAVLTVLVTAMLIAPHIAAQTPTGQSVVSDKDLAAAINSLGAFDFPARTAASRTVRRAAAAQAVPALAAAAKSNADSYVQYRALVLLAGFDDPSTPQVMQSIPPPPSSRP